MKQILIIATVTFLFLYNDTYAQINVYERMYGTTGNDNIASILPADSGQFYLVGNVEFPQNDGGYDVYIIKCDSLGDTLWTRAYGLADWDFVSGADLTSDGGVVVSGESDLTGGNQFDPFLMKIDRNGNLLWSNSYGSTGGEEGGKVILTSDNGFIQAAGTGSSGAGFFDFLITKTDSTGAVQWSYTYGTSASENAIDVLETGNGEYMVLGVVGNEVALIRLSSTGSLIWDKSYLGLGSVNPTQLMETSDGNFLITGDIVDSWRDLFAIKVDNSGDTLWTKSFGGTNANDYGGAVLEPYPNHYLFTGTRYAGMPDDGYMIMTNQDSDTLWTNSFYDGIRVAATINNNEILLGGSSWGGGGWGGLDIYLAKPNLLGYTGCNISPISVAIINHAFIVSSHGYTQGPGFMDTSLGFTEKNVPSETNLLCSETDTTIVIQDTSTNQDQFIKLSIDYSIFPNPASTHINITNTPDKVSVYNIVGSRYEVTFINQKQIDISSLPSGTYIIDVDGLRKKLIVYRE